MSAIILASGNAGKIREFRALFANLGIEIIPQRELGIEDSEETGLSFIENAILKARHAARLGNLPAIADDSGLMVTALGGAPGIYSARYSGNHGDDTANNRKLLVELSSIENRHACFVSTIAYCAHANDPLPIIATGLWQGEILSSTRGDGGFGYDPLFWIPALQKSAAELSREEKNAISHRAQALQTFMKIFTSKAAV